MSTTSDAEHAPIAHARFVSRSNHLFLRRFARPHFEALLAVLVPEAVTPALALIPCVAGHELLQHHGRCHCIRRLKGSVVVVPDGLRGQHQGLRGREEGVLWEVVGGGVVEAKLGLVELEGRRWAEVVGVEVQAVVSVHEGARLMGGCVGRTVDAELLVVVILVGASAGLTSAVIASDLEEVLLLEHPAHHPPVFLAMEHRGDQQIRHA